MTWDEFFNSKFGGVLPWAALLGWISWLLRKPLGEFLTKMTKWDFFGLFKGERQAPEVPLPKDTTELSSGESTYHLGVAIMAAVSEAYHNRRRKLIKSYLDRSIKFARTLKLDEHIKNLEDILQKIDKGTDELSKEESFLLVGQLLNLSQNLGSLLTQRGVEVVDMDWSCLSETFVFSQKDLSKESPEVGIFVVGAAIGTVGTLFKHASLQSILATLRVTIEAVRTLRFNRQADDLATLHKELQESKALWPEKRDEFGDRFIDIADSIFAYYEKKDS